MEAVRVGHVRLDAAGEDAGQALVLRGGGTHRALNAAVVCTATQLKTGLAVAAAAIRRGRSIGGQGCSSRPSRHLQAGR